MRQSVVEELVEAFAVLVIVGVLALLFAGCAPLPHIPTRVEVEMVACEVRCSPALPLFYAPATESTPPICICQGHPWTAPDAESEPERLRAPGRPPAGVHEARQ